MSTMIKNTMTNIDSQPDATEQATRSLKHHHVMIMIVLGLITLMGAMYLNLFNPVEPTPHPTLGSEKGV